MKRIGTRGLSLLLSLVLILGTVTLCWLSLPNTVDFPTSFGSANATYFESGEGSADDPYIISQPVHLYNLAWLQYLGYFNLNPNLNNGRTQSYFRLKNNIVMTGTAIPPIGTEEYPFIGRFDGDGYTMSSVTVSNAYSDLTRHPTAAVFDTTTDGGKLLTAGSGAGTAQEVALVGLFGVTGDYGAAIESGKNENYAGKNCYQYVDPDAEEKTLISPSESPSVNDLYYAAMYVGNFYTDILHIRSASVKTLVGLAAGYVKGTLENVGVYRADITLSANAKALDGEGTVVSKYAIVGDYDEDSVGWGENPASGGGSQGPEDKWGGSIDFKNFSRRLNYMITRTYSGQTKPTAGFYASENSAFHMVTYSYFAGNNNKNGAQFDWEGLASGITYGYTDLKDGTYLPLNVDEDTVFGDTDGVLNQTTDNGWKINDWYANNAPERASPTNTGYIVGGDGGGTYGHIRVRIQTLAISSAGTIDNSLLGSEGTTAQYSEANLLLYTKNADNNSSFVGIKDEKNANNASLPPGCIESRKLINYDKARDNFKNFLGGNGYLYGMRFEGSNISYNGTANNSSFGANAAYVTIDGKEYVKRAINFNVKAAGVITAVVGSYQSTSTTQSMFGLYKVERDAEGKITAVNQIERVYEYKGTDTTKEKYPMVFAGGTDSYSSATDYTKAYDRAWFADLPVCTAYYVEIPVPSGDYIISKDVQTTKNQAYINYLDIGANGAGDDDPSGGQTTKAKPYLMQSVDFINDSSTDTDGKVTVPSDGNTRTYPAYADVGLELSGVTGDVVLALKRASGTGTRQNADGKAEIVTILYFSRTWNGSPVTSVEAKPLPDSDLVREDTSLRKEEDESG